MTSGPDRPLFVTRRSLPSERLGAQRPAFTRQLAAMVAGLQLDPGSRKLGGEDAGAGLFRLTVEEIQNGGRGEIDVLAYMRGWYERKAADRRRRDGNGG